MLSFDSSIRKSADLKTQPSSFNWVEQNKCTPYSIWRIFLASSALSSSKTLWGRWGCRRQLLGGNFEKLKQQNFARFFFLVASSASSSSKTLKGRWQCRRRPPQHFFWGNFEKKISLFFSFFFWLIFCRFFYLKKIK